MNPVGYGSVGQGGGCCVDGVDHFGKGSSDKGRGVKKVDSAGSKIHQNAVDVGTRSKDMEAFSIRSAQVAVFRPTRGSVSHDGIKKEEFKKRMKAMKPVVDTFIKKFQNGGEYKQHKFKKPSKKSYLLDAIGITLFGKGGGKEARQFSNSLRAHLEKNNIVAKNDQLDIGEDKLKAAIYQYVMENYGVDIEVVVLSDVGDVRLVNGGAPLGDGTYKVPVLFINDSRFLKFRGISLEAPSNENDTAVDYALPDDMIQNLAKYELLDKIASDFGRTPIKGLHQHHETGLPIIKAGLPENVAGKIRSPQLSATPKDVVDAAHSLAQEGLISEGEMDEEGDVWFDALP